MHRLRAVCRIRFGLAHLTARTDQAGHLGIPFDEAWERVRCVASTRDRATTPSADTGRSCVSMSKPLVVRRRGVAGEVDLADMLHGKLRGSAGVETVIGRRDDDVVHVEQQAAAGSRRASARGSRFRPAVAVEPKIRRRILDQERRPSTVWVSSTWRATSDSVSIVVGQRQKVVQADAVMRRPGEMFGHDERLIAIDDRLEAGEMAGRHAAVPSRSTSRRRAPTADRAL